MTRSSPTLGSSPESAASGNGPDVETWLLVQPQEDAPFGRSWFKEWTAIGPAGTWDADEAARFPSEQAAMDSPAFSFWGTFYRPERVE